MFPISFDKARAEYVLDCLKNGKAIDPDSADGWSVHGCLALAGACFFQAVSHGAPLYKALGVDPSTFPQERQEAIEETLVHDLHAAIEFYCHLTMLVCDNEFDQRCEPYVTALVTQDGTLKKTLKPLEGFKIPDPENN